LQEKIDGLLQKGMSKNAEEAKKAVADLVAEEAKKINAELKTANNDLKSDIQVVRDELEKERKEREDWQTEVNRFRTFAKEQESKGRKFDVALDEAIDANMEQIKGFANGESKKVRMQLKAVGDMGLSNISGLTAANTQVASGIQNLPNQRIHMRNILNTGRMTTSSFTYLQETGGEGAPDVWGENSGPKPRLDLDYIEKIAPSQFIAGILKISRKSLDDMPALRSSLANRLLEMYLVAEDNQILNGTGAGNQLQGLMPVATPYDGEYTNATDRIIDAQGQLEEALYYATGVIVKPRDYARILLNKGNTDEYTLPGLGAVSMQNGVMYLAGVPIYKVNAMPSATRQFLAGDFLMGAQLLLREDPVVEFFAEDENNVQTNQITVRVEGRVALPIYRQEAFVKGAIEGAPVV